jgi:hypothetical protein
MIATGELMRAQRRSDEADFPPTNGVESTGFETPVLSPPASLALGRGPSCLALQSARLQKVTSGDFAPTKG